MRSRAIRIATNTNSYASGIIRRGGPTSNNASIWRRFQILFRGKPKSRTIVGRGGRAGEPWWFWDPACKFRPNNGKDTIYISYIQVLFIFLCIIYKGWIQRTSVSWQTKNALYMVARMGWRGGQPWFDTLSSNKKTAASVKEDGVKNGEDKQPSSHASMAAKKKSTYTHTARINATNHG